MFLLLAEKERWEEASLPGIQYHGKDHSHFWERTNPLQSDMKWLCVLFISTGLI